MNIPTPVLVDMFIHIRITHSAMMLTLDCECDPGQGVKNNDKENLQVSYRFGIVLYDFFIPISASKYMIILFFDPFQVISVIQPFNYTRNSFPLSPTPIPRSLKFLTPCLNLSYEVGPPPHLPHIHHQSHPFYLCNGNDHFS